MLFVILVLVISPRLSSAIQVKFFVLTAMLFFLLYLYRFKARFFLFREHSVVTLFRASFLISTILGLVFLYGFALDLASSSLNRGNSGNVRNLVNVVMLEQLGSNLEAMLFGFGFGASGADIDISSEIGRELISVPHSGLISIIYELGIVGVTVILALLFVFIFRQYSISRIGVGNRIYTHYLSFLVVFYSIWNLVIISGFPNAEPFWFYSAGFMIMKFVLLSRLNIGKLNDKTA